MNFIDRIREESGGFKSVWQIDLESQGWEYMGNDTINTIFVDGEELYLDEVEQKPTSPMSDNQLQMEWLQRGAFKDVKVTNAYDIRGRFLPNLRGIYVKRK